MIESVTEISDQWRHDSAPLAVLCSPELIAVGSIWKRQRRVFSAQFGGSSMQPAINNTDEVVVDCGKDEPSVGEVVARVYADRVIVHRVTLIAPDRRWMITRGDANIRPDPPLLDRSELVGTIVELRRNGMALGVPSASRSFLASVIETACRIVARLGDGALVCFLVGLWNPLAAMRMGMRALSRRERGGAR